MMDIELARIETGFKAEDTRCWVHARAGLFPDGRAVMTVQPLRLTGSDIFYGLSSFFFDGEVWSGPVEQKNLGRRPWQDRLQMVMCDGTPAYHQPSGKMLLTGQTVIYDNDEIMADPRPRHTVYSVYDEAEQTWGEFKSLEMPDEDSSFFSCGSGSGQRVDLCDGTILVPVYHMPRELACDAHGNCYSAAVARCSFDGTELKYLEHGNSLTVPEPRGLYEPSIMAYGGRYYLTLRNDIKGYVSVSDDGLNYSEPKPWCYDDGDEIGNYNTQQHWLSVGGKLYLVYTRKAENNHHVFRHRGPLFIAQVDPERLCLIRASEQVAIPERGARMGNFGCVQVSVNEGWVVVSEWMQNDTAGFGLAGVQHCMSHGSDNSIFIAKISSCGAC
jgi:hypothetical protein